MARRRSDDQCTFRFSRASEPKLEACPIGTNRLRHRGREHERLAPQSANEALWGVR